MYHIWKLQQTLKNLRRANCEQLLYESFPVEVFFHTHPASSDSESQNNKHYNVRKTNYALTLTSPMGPLSSEYVAMITFTFSTIRWKVW